MDIEKNIDNIKEELRADEEVQIRVAVFGQPGAGKSSLINSILGESAAQVGVGNDTTKQECLYEYNGLYFADLPGYDTARFPVDTYLQRFDLNSYDAFICVFGGKFHAADAVFFRQLQAERESCLLVRTGLDMLFERHKSLEELKAEITQDAARQLERVVPLYFVSNRSGAGLEQLVLALEDSLPETKRERFIRGVKARSVTMLADKYQACEKLVAKYAWLAAANAINPIPGLDVSIDLKLMNKMFDELKRTYGLNQAKLDRFRGVLPLAERVLAMGTKEGMVALMKNYVGKQGVEGLAKYVPYAGQAVAMGLGYALTSNLGKKYLDDCHELATGILQNKLADL